MINKTQLDQQLNANNNVDRFNIQIHNPRIENHISSLERKDVIDIQTKTKIVINEDLENFVGNLAEISQKISEYPQDKDAILLCGDTGAGKSTLVNYLLDRDGYSVPKENSKEFLIEFKNPLTTLGHGFSSQTSIPVRCSIDKNTVVYYDCPGFEDNRGSLVDIENGFAMSQISHKMSNVKVLVVLAEDSFKDRRGQPVSLLLEKILNMFPSEDFESKKENNLHQSVTVCITKTGSIKDHKKALLDVVKDSKNIQLKEFVEKLSKNNRIVLFPAPKKQDVLDNTYKAEILSKIDKSVFTESNLEPIISIDSRKTLRQIFNYVNDKCSQLLDLTCSQISSVFGKIKNEDLEIFAKKIMDIYPISEDKKDIDILFSLEQSFRPFDGLVDSKGNEVIFKEIKFLATEFIEGMTGKLLTNGDYFETETLSIPIEKMIARLREELKNRGMIDPLEVRLQSKVDVLI